MMRGLSVPEILELHRMALELSGGADGIRDMGALHSAVMQPHMTFGGSDLYPTLEDKAAALCFSLVMNHPFVDGNKRVGHAAMETMLVLHGKEIDASVEEQELVVLRLAAGEFTREDFTTWVKSHCVPLL